MHFIAADKMHLEKKVAGMCEKKLYLRYLCKTSVSLITGYYMTGVSKLSVAKLRHYKVFFHMFPQ